nr:uncharacterized protein LOC109752776 [Aegilops tauschii subsp. strangulata]
MDVMGYLNKSIAKLQMGLAVWRNKPELFESADMHEAGKEKGFSTMKTWMPQGRPARNVLQTGKVLLNSEKHHRRQQCQRHRLLGMQKTSLPNRLRNASSIPDATTARSTIGVSSVSVTASSACRRRHSQIVSVMHPGIPDATTILPAPISIIDCSLAWPMGAPRLRTMF